MTSSSRCANQAVTPAQKQDSATVFLPWQSTAVPPSAVDVLVVGGGPAGAAAAAHAALRGFSVALLDAQVFPRDKTCGDGLTPRAIAELERLGISEKVFVRTRNFGLKLHGFGGSVTAPWAGTTSGTSAFPSFGSAVPRQELDTMLVTHAYECGALVFDGWKALSVQLGTRPELSGPAVTSVNISNGQKQQTIRARWLLIADGVRSTLGKQLGRTWHRDQVFGVAARSYASCRDDSWIHSHLELRDTDGTLLPGYGWIFPLGNGRANVGCGALATAKRPAKTNTKKLLRHYASVVRDEWEMSEPTNVTSALLPMGGAVSHVAGANWALLGDAACLVNPLNGEGIDYGMESARLAVELLDSIQHGRDGLVGAWPALLRSEFGEGFSLARRLAKALTYPQFLPVAGPLTIGAPWGESLMAVAARLMGNLVTDADRDIVARAWHSARKISTLVDVQGPWQ